MHFLQYFAFQAFTANNDCQSSHVYARFNILGWIYIFKLYSNSELDVETEYIMFIRQNSVKYMKRTKTNKGLQK